MIFKKILLGLVLFGFYQLVQADEIRPNPLTVDYIISPQATAPYLFVVNNSKSTSIWTKTYDGKSLLLWQHPFMREAGLSPFTFKADKHGDFLNLTTIASYDQGNIVTVTTVADLKNDRVTAPSYTLKDYNSDGIGAYLDSNTDYLVLKPLFGNCAAPTILKLQQYAHYTTMPDYRENQITFTDSHHLEIDYLAELGLLMGEEHFKINSLQVMQHCKSTITAS